MWGSVVYWLKLKGSFLIYLSLCSTTAFLAFYSSSQSLSESSPLIKKADQIATDNFRYEPERKLGEIKEQENEKLEPQTVEILNVNRRNLARVLQGLKVDDEFLHEASFVTQDLRQGWMQTQNLIRQLPGASLSVEQLFAQALEEYENGMQAKGFPADRRGDSSLKRAHTLFLMVLKADPPASLRDYSLYFAGDIALQLWDENMDLSGLVLLIEVLRSTSQTELAEKAWYQMNGHIHFGYSGSSGDHTPSSWRKFLADTFFLTDKDRGPLPSLSFQQR